jgi:biotin carboxyl carrier protein
MFQATVNNGNKFEIQQAGDALLVDGKPLEWDLVNLGRNRYHLLWEGRSYQAELVSLQPEEKTLTLKLNGRLHSIVLKDRYDLLLEKMGLNNLAAHKVNQLKAPMPGLIFSINTEVGAEVKKGEALLILEAMKMENVLKSPGDGTIKEIRVKQGESVEKNQVLIVFA